jgi:RNA polymerase sigma-70 factor (ECF subfamily)
MSDRADDERAWLGAFHRGDRATLEQCYREHFSTVTRAVGGYLKGADAETVVHEVFFKLLSQPGARHAFTGGSLGAWLSRVASNQAVDFLRRQQREVPDGLVPPLEGATTFEDAAEARMMLQRFKAECLPPKWRGVFEARFERQLDQRSAAKELNMFRTTLAYQELRIRALLERFFLGD